MSATEKTRTQAKVDTLLAEKDARIAELEAEVRELQAELDDLKKILAARDDEIASLKQQINNAARMIADVSETLDPYEVKDQYGSREEFLEDVRRGLAESPAAIYEHLAATIDDMLSRDGVVRASGLEFRKDANGRYIHEFPDGKLVVEESLLNEGRWSYVIDDGDLVTHNSFASSSFEEAVEKATRGKPVASVAEIYEDSGLELVQLKPAQDAATRTPVASREEELEARVAELSAKAMSLEKQLDKKNIEIESLEERLSCYEPVREGAEAPAGKLFPHPDELEPRRAENGDCYHIAVSDERDRTDILISYERETDDFTVACTAFSEENLVDNAFDIESDFEEAYTDAYRFAKRSAKVGGINAGGKSIARNAIGRESFARAERRLVESTRESELNARPVQIQNEPTRAQTAPRI